MKFGQVGPPSWEGKTVFLIGGGPSLYGFDFSRLAGRILCGINQSIFDADCDVGVSIDPRFVIANHDKLARFAAKRELYLALGDCTEIFAPVAHAIYLRDEEKPGLSLDCSIIRRGATSGCTALNVAVLKGARRIVLLGYDYGNAGTTRHHYHDKYNWILPRHLQSWSAWSEHYAAVALDCRKHGIEVINASPQSAISAFPKCSIEEALADASSAPM